MRKPRLLKKGAKYHVTAGINRGEKIFQFDEIKNLFLNVVERSKSKYNFLLYDLVVSDNNIQFIIKPLKKESLSKIMQWIMTVFAMNFNSIYKTEGHVWIGRYKSKIAA